MNKFVKITVGFVQQIFEKKPDGKYVCTDQAFIAGDQCDYEDVNGDSLKDIPEHEYEPYGKRRTYRGKLFGRSLVRGTQEYGIFHH